MSQYLYNTLFGVTSHVTNLLFTANDSIIFQPGLDANDVAVTTDGVTTTLSVAGTSLSVPTSTFSQASQAGLVTFADGSHLMGGTAGDDQVSGTAGDDATYGGSGNDSISSGDGSDNDFGGAGSDTIDGGAGNDHIYGESSSGGAADGADSISGGAGSDYIQGNAGDDWLDGGDGSDRINGGADNDTIIGGAGNDSVNGNFGNDHIDGGVGNDLLRGGKGDDIVAGRDGNDTLMGDLGADTLTGGAGSDLFSFRGSDSAAVSSNTIVGNIDTIIDFEQGADHLSLGFTIAGLEHGSAGNGATALLLAQALLAGHPSHEAAAISVGGDTMLFYNSGGSGIVDSVIDLHGVSETSLNAADFQ